MQELRHSFLTHFRPGTPVRNNLQEQDVGIAYRPA